ncbi:MAG: CBS domain-containing protein [Syntrophobacteraceae bacterium]|jgi:CBS domain-containing protein|nr:CBS domain-containing protein [Syntrophobacteraceae bacterium]MCU0586669.1 CBS domain-containing protein [Syntrophobacteraceae bacterium]
MGVTARDVMETRFYSLRPGSPVSEAARLFLEANRESRQRVFGMLVTDGEGALVGMLSMYDLLLLLRPKHIHIWGEMSDMEVEDYLQEACRRTRPMLVGDIMTTDLLTITPDTHVLMIVDIMLKKHIRRLPVLEDGRVVGIVYLSKVFQHMMERLV